MLKVGKFVSIKTSDTVYTLEDVKVDYSNQDFHDKNRYTTIYKTFLKKSQVIDLIEKLSNLLK